MRVLLVDDEKELVSTLAERLTIRGIQADWETFPEEALKKIEKEKYDLAVLDMKMPKMDGIELKKKMEIVHPEMKFIFMTGHGSEGTFKAGVLEASDDCYLIKPVNLEILVNKMKEVLDGHDGDSEDNNWELIGERGFQFFGKMTASVSHEIKNVLAIINENSGLLQDLLFMSEQGKPLDPQRLQRVSELISKQVKRADTIIKNLNTFAHSTDEPVKTLNIHDMMETVLALSGRLADMKGVALARQPSSAEAVITTRPFLLEYLLWSCLDFAMDMTGAKKRVVVDVKNKGDEVCISLSGLQDLATNRETLFPEGPEKALLNILQGRIAINADHGTVEIMLPENLA